MKINIDCVNEFDAWNLDIDKFIAIAKSIFEYYIKQPEIIDKFCLKDCEYESVSFDFLLCNSEKTHYINRDYRNKDYPADIITFAVYADSLPEERFIIDDDINLGEIIIALDKMIEGASEKGIQKEEELAFFISHGILHLLGFDHQDEQEYNFVIEYQKKALESRNIKYDKI